MVFLCEYIIEKAKTREVVLPINIRSAIIILGTVFSRGVMPVVMPTVPIAEIHSNIIFV